MDTVVEQEVCNHLFQGRMVRTKDNELVALYQYCGNNIWQAILLNEDFTWKRLPNSREPYKTHINVEDITEIIRDSIMEINNG